MEKMTPMRRQIVEEALRHSIVGRHLGSTFPFLTWYLKRSVLTRGIECNIDLLNPTSLSRDIAEKPIFKKWFAHNSATIDFQPKRIFGKLGFLEILRIPRGNAYLVLRKKLVSDRSEMANFSLFADFFPFCVGWRIGMIYTFIESPDRADSNTL